MNESPDQNINQQSPAANDVGHVPVLAQQVMEYLAPQPGEVMVDATLGRGGHAFLMGPKLTPGGWYVGLDVDPVNLNYAKERLSACTRLGQQVDIHQIGPVAQWPSGRVPNPIIQNSPPSTSCVTTPLPCRVDCIHANFQQVRSVLDALGIARIHLLLADLGFSSNQMDDPARGFSFQHDGPLDMRLNPDLPTSAADLLNQLPERELADLIYQYGEERLSRRIARNIVETRRRSPMLFTSQLADLVRRCYGPAGRHSRIDPATRTFMALRIAVNGELEALENLLKSLPDILAPGARAGIISFHSLEDRLVKRAWQQWQREGKAKLLTKKPLTATEDECRTNPRSRSAKMRVLVWQGTGREAGA